MAKKPRRLDAVDDNTLPAPPIRARRTAVRPLNEAQQRYDDAIRTSEIIFGVGPSGSGKTWFAAMRAAEAVKAGHCEKIVVTRPAVEAGESLGFLPGELDEKYQPYFRPVEDALVEAFGRSHLDNLIRNGKVEARPLGLLRGASIAGAFVIADEMQNASLPQFKLLLTRGGDGTKFVVNGDPRQTDLPLGASGLLPAIDILSGVEGVQVVHFGRGDIVRSGLTQRVVEAFEDGPSRSIRTRHPAAD